MQELQVEVGELVMGEGLDVDDLFWLTQGRRPIPLFDKRAGEIGEPGHRVAEQVTVVTRAQHRDAVLVPDLSSRTNMVDVAVGHSDRHWNEMMGSQGITKELFSAHTGIDDDALRPLIRALADSNWSEKDL